MAKPKITVTCLNCQKPFQTHECWVKLGRGKYCSRSCFHKNHHRKPLAERFWSKVNKDGPIMRPELGPCWPWIGAFHPQGYGSLGGELAHRLAWQLTNGPLPDGVNVLHKCDWKPCSNVEHLFLGTQADNMQDMIRKGRHAKGSMKRTAKLTDGSVREIRILRKSGTTVTELAHRFGVSRRTLGKAIARLTWKHVA